MMSVKTGGRASVGSAQDMQWWCARRQPRKEPFRAQRGCAPQGYSQRGGGKSIFQKKTVLLETVPEREIYCHHENGD
jgi:hypothetical protein